MMTTFDERREAIRGLLNSAAELARNWESCEVATSLDWAAQRLDDDRFYVVVCGEYKRGKSSLINALLSEPDLLPVDVDIATRTVTVITYAPEERITVYLDDSAGPRAIGRSEIRRYAAEGQEGGGRPRMLVIETPNERLRSGVALVDTPGVGGLNEAHSAATLAFLPLAGAVLFTADAVEPLTSGELEFARRAAAATSMVFTVVTKSDLVDDAAAIVASTRRKLSNTLRLPENEIAVLPVSSRLRLRYLTSEDPADLAESDFAALEQLLFEQLPARPGSTSLVRALRLLRNSLAALELPLQVERSLCDDQASAETLRLRRQLQDAEMHLDQFAHESAEWRGQLLRGTRAISNILERRCRSGFDDLRTAVEEDYLYNRHLLAEPAQLSDRLQEEMMLLVGELSSEANRGADRLLAELSGAASAELRAAIAPLQIGLTDASEQLSSLKAAVPPGYKEVSAGQGTGPFILGILGGLVGAAAGWKLGGGARVTRVSGAMSGWSRGRAIGAQLGRITQSILAAKDQLRELGQDSSGEENAGQRLLCQRGIADPEAIRSQMSDIAQRLLDENERQVLDALSVTVTEFQQAIEQELDQLITAQRDALLQSRQVLEEGIKRPIEQRTDRKASLDQRLAELNRIGAAAAGLEFELSGAAA